MWVIIIIEFKIEIKKWNEVNFKISHVESERFESNFSRLVEIYESDCNNNTLVIDKVEVNISY